MEKNILWTLGPGTQLGPQELCLFLGWKRENS